METSDILKKVRKIEIKSRGLSNQIFSGEYHSAFKGRGMAFSEVREYQYGDDIRNIDWNVTARFNHPYIKVFDEERELTVMILVDVSGSNEYGTRSLLKEDLMTEVSALLAFSAIHNNDKVGVIFFSDIIEKFIPPQKGLTHILRIIRELIDFKPQSQKTNISEALRFLTNGMKKRCTAFLLSDFIDTNFEDALKIAGNKHDLAALQIIDTTELRLPDIGLVQVYTKELNKSVWVDTSDKVIRNEFGRKAKARMDFLESTFKRSGVDYARMYTGQDYVKPLLNLFRAREARK
jgi:uncharacterized protein (DUF58 family)